MWPPPNSESTIAASKASGRGIGLTLRRRQVNVVRPDPDRESLGFGVEIEIASIGTPVVRPTAVTPLELQAVAHPDERGDVVGGRLLEHLLGGVELLERACSHDRQAVAERERLDLVVGDVHRR